MAFLEGMKIALAQIDTTVGDVEGNEARILAALGEARRQGASLVVFPELAVTGYPPRDLLDDPGLVRRAARTTARIAAAAPDLTVVLGTIEPGKRRLRNTAAILQGGRVVDVRAKRLLPDYDVFFEPRWFEPGSMNTTLELLGVRAGILICEDLWDEEYDAHPGPELRSEGAVGSSRVDLQACKLEYSIVSPK